MTGQRLNGELSSGRSTDEKTGLKWRVTQSMRVHRKKSEQDSDQEHVDNDYGVHRCELPVLVNEEEAL